MNPGTRFYKCDLHVHTPASKDFQDKSATPDDVIQAAIAAGIEILGVTDHNAVEWLDRMRDASKGTSVTIIPGVEITTPHGHIIGLFDASRKSSEIADLLVQAKIPRDKHGYEEAMSGASTEEVIKLISDAGGLAIAAHANSTSGLLKEGKGQYKLRIVPMEQLSALELSKEKDITGFCGGSIPKYPKKACIQGSDAHALAEIGRRPTYMKTETPSLRGLRQALLDYEVRVRFPWNYKKADHPRILSLKIKGGFFDGEEFPFSESLNCLVGGTGTGKSTVIEFLRYCFEDPPAGFESLLVDHKGKIEKLVGDGGVLEVRYLDSDGEIKIVRRQVMGWHTPREVQDEAGNPATLESAPVFFSQGELIRVAAEPLAQMDLIDRRIDVKSDAQAEAEAIKALEVNALALPQASDTRDRLKAKIDDPEKGLKATEERCKQLETRLSSTLLKTFPNWEAEQSYLKALSEDLDEFLRTVKTQLDEIDTEVIGAETPENAPNSSQLTPLEQIPKDLANAVTQARKQLVKAVQAAQAKVKTATDGIAPKFEAEEKKLTQLLEDLGQKDVNQATARFRAQKKRLKDLKKDKANIRDAETKIKKLTTERGTLRTKLRTTRQSRWKKRRDKAAELTRELANLVTIGVIEGGNKGPFREAVRKIAHGARLQAPWVKMIAEQVDPADLVDCILNNDGKRLKSLSGLDTAHARKFMGAAGSRKLKDVYAIDVVEMPDKPSVLYDVPNQRQKPLGELSTGQKGTVIIAVAMVEGAGPLVIDQPEEPLDTRSIYGQIVKKLRASKDGRQFLFTTHNPNVAVGADAELSHVLDASADKGYIKSSGGVDHPDTNKLLLLHLEGGRDALELRIKKYEE